MTEMSSEIKKKYHVFFWYHDDDQRWAWVARTRMEACHPGIKCFCYKETSLLNGELTDEFERICTKIRSAIFTVVVLSSKFLSGEWVKLDKRYNSGDEIHPRNHLSMLFGVHSVLCLLVEELQELPSAFSGLTTINLKQEQWWAELMTCLTSQERLDFLDTSTNVKENGTRGACQGIRNGTLICSLKSKHGNCGQEQVDLTEMPAELRRLRLKLGRREYQNVLAYLMSAANFRFRFCCHNFPLTVFVFCSLLAVCLTIVPVIEVRIYKLQGDGMEYLHAVVVWSTILFLFLVTSYAMRRRMSRGTYKRLFLVNSHLTKYNLLAGVQYLGIKQCHRFTLHLYYYNISECQAYLQELLSSMEESVTGQHPSVALDMSSHTDADTAGVAMSLTGDVRRALHPTPSTNASLQVEAEDLLLNHSGLYVKLLSTNRLPVPDSPRHSDDVMCLCQYAEQFIKKHVIS